MSTRFLIRATLTFVVVGACYAAGLAQGRSTWDGIYSEAQAQRGAQAFDAQCAGCHGPNGNGGSMAPSLNDSTFAADFDNQTVGDLFERNRTTMPPGKEGKLSGEEIADITAFILQVNKFPAGANDMASSGSMLKGIKYLAQKP